MSSALVNALVAIRRTCAELKRDASPESRGKLDILCTVLAGLIVDTRDGEGLRGALAKHFEGHVEIRDGVDEGVDLSAALAKLQAELRFKSENGGDLAPLIKLAAGLGMAQAQSEDQAIRNELAAGAVIAPDDSSDDEFDFAALRTYLALTFPDEAGIEVIAANVASRGFSKKTVILSLRNNRRLPAELVLRIDRPFNFLGTSVADEYLPLKTLHESGIRVPKPFALEKTGKVAGEPFVVFEKIDGAPVGSNFTFPARNMTLAADVAACLAQLHAVPVAKMGAIRGAEGSVVEGVRWEIDKSYADWIELERHVPVVEAAFAWLRANIERADGTRTIVHGDYNFNNLLVKDNRVQAIVDWEFVHAGTPASDLGWFYYGAESVAGWEQFLDLYCDAGGPRFDRAQLDFYILLGQTRLTVMLLQTVVGFAAGKFDDIRFGLTAPLFLNHGLMRIGSLLERLS